MTELDEEQKLEIDLRDWALANKVTLKATTSLLQVLRPHHGNLPKDARTLMKTPRSSVGRAVPPGR
jgi:hypothetical protein